MTQNLLPEFSPGVPRNPVPASPAAARRRVVVADDHLVVVMGITKVLESGPDVYSVTTTTSISGLMQVLREAPCDVLVCDYSFDGDAEPDGLQLLERIRRLYPDVKIILLTAHDDAMIVQQALRLGVVGFLSKVSDEFSSLSTVIDSILAGKIYLDPKTSEQMVRHMVANQMADGSPSSAGLSPREMEVLRLFARGMTVTEIAQYTNRSLKTISSQKKNAMIKLGVRNDVELLNAFRQLP
jgi:two-component system capsular synthesis response regulator RcsB